MSSPVCHVTVPIRVVSNLFNCASLTHGSLNFQLNACPARRDALMLNFIARRLPWVQATLLVQRLTLPASACHPLAPSPPFPVHIVSQIPSSLVALALASPPPPTSPNHPPPILFTLTVNSHFPRLMQRANQVLHDGGRTISSSLISSFSSSFRGWSTYPSRSARVPGFLLLQTVSNLGGVYFRDTPKLCVVSP